MFVYSETKYIRFKLYQYTRCPKRKNSKFSMLRSMTVNQTSYK